MSANLGKKMGKRDFLKIVASQKIYYYTTKFISQTEKRYIFAIRHIILHYSQTIFLKK